MKRHRHHGAPPAAPVLIAALALAAGCASPHRTQASPGPSTATPPRTTATASPSAPATGSPTPSPTASDPHQCLSHDVQVRYPGQDNPLRSVCVHTGTRITITLQARGSYRWTPVTASAPAVTSLLSDHLSPDGTRTADALAGVPGTATLTSADTFTPDPHGPPSRMWQLHVRVVR